MKEIDWEARTWELFRCIATANCVVSDDIRIRINTFIIFAREAVEQYRKSMEEIV